MAEKTLTRRILLVAVVARLLVFVAALHGVFMLGAGRTQANLAENILHGKGFMLSESMMHPDGEEDAPPMFRNSFEFYRRVDGYYGALRPGRPTMFLVPGYAIFMAGIFAVFGSGTLLAVRGVQLISGVLTVLIGLKIAGRFLEGRYLLFAGLFIAIDPFELYYEALPATQALFSLLFLLAILISLRLIDRSLRGGRFFPEVAFRRK